MKVFEIARSWADIPLTVVAPTLEEAERIHREWIEAHHLDRLIAPVSIFPYGEGWLKARPPLAKVAAENKAGIAYWDPGSGSWRVADPKDAPLGLLATPPGPIECYRFEATEEQKPMVFAETHEEAVTIFCWRYEIEWGEEPGWFLVRKLSRWDLVGDLATLRDDMDAGISGIAGKDENGHWRIMPVGWDQSDD
jgi:hypothetical protein